jgi:hypothetical protein
MRKLMIALVLAASGCIIAAAPVLADGWVGW